MSTARAWSVVGVGEPRDVLQLVEREMPAPGSTQLIVRTLATAANFPDVLMCRGEYQVEPVIPFTPGLEVCGEVADVGDAVEGFEPGDRVVGATVLPNGGFATHAVMDESTTFPAPAALDNAEAAALYIGYQTGWFGLVRRAGLQAGETLLVHAAAGGVGSAAVQVGKALGARVVGVVRGSEKAEVVRALGADVVVDRTCEDFVEVVNALTDGRGADVVYDPVGGDVFERSTKCIAFEGRIVLIGFAGGSIGSARLNHVLIKNYSVLGLHWGLYTEREPSLLYQCHRDLTAMVDGGLVRPLIGGRFGMDELPLALRRLADGRTVGRLVIQLSPPHARSERLT